MNKKFSTLMAGLLLAGGMFSVNAADIKLDVYKGDKVTEIKSNEAYFLVLEESTANYAYGVKENADGTYTEDVNKIGSEEIDDSEINNYLWYVTEFTTSAVGDANKTYGYALKNKATGKYLTFEVENDVAKVKWADSYDREKVETYIVVAGSGSYTGSNNFNIGNWSQATSNFIDLNDNVNPSNQMTFVGSTAAGTFSFYYYDFCKLFTIK